MPNLMANFSPQLIELEKFVVETRYEDLPAAVVHYTKFLLMDSIGCALAGLSTDPSKMSVALARQMGGPSVASILGMSDKVSTVCAAFVNGDLIRSIDYCAMLPGGHQPAFIIPPSLALAEATGVSGKELIEAVALGFEFTSRVSSALGGVPFTFAPDGTFVQPKRIGRIPATILGATAAAGKIRHLDQGKMANALGTASHLGQGSGGVVFMCSPHRTMQKWGYAGWQNMGAMMAVSLAESGYTGDIEIFDPENNIGYEEYQPDKLNKDLGKTWTFARVNYKPYPCCRVLHTPLDCFISIIEQNKILPEEISVVKVYTHPHVNYPVFTNRELNNIVDIQYSIPYVIALAAYRIRVGVEWQDWDTVRDPKIVAFTGKVISYTHPEFGKQWISHPGSYLSKVEVAARGKTFSEERIFSKGTPGTEFAMTDKELEAKFRHNACRVLTGAKIEGAVNALLNLEKLSSVSELISQITV
jgi:2-methylcitrate dehydratase PrpD